MFIFSNLAISLDGKIATRERKLFPLGTAEDWKQMENLRSKSDAILMGASTLRSYKKPCTTSIPSNTHKKTQLINAILSTQLDGFSPSWEFFRSSNIRRILFVHSNTPQQRLRKYSSHSEIIVLKKATSKNPIALQIVQNLGKLGVQNLLVEGGGSLMWDFVEYNLIDEYHVTLTPRIIGGELAPTLVDGVGFSAHQVLKLKLKQCITRGNELFLTYSRAHPRKIKIHT